jgi:type 1 fimbriae regulatory protein FimB/type 1 fimbriae regulatory protein FimE
LSGVELRAMRRLKRDQDPPSPFVFKSERGAPSRRRDGARWWRGWAPRLARLGVKAHPHMLRHARGFQLANQDTYPRTLQAYLGQSPARFKTLWRD